MIKNATIIRALTGILVICFFSVSVISRSLATGDAGYNKTNPVKSETSLPDEEEGEASGEEKLERNFIDIKDYRSPDLLSDQFISSHQVGIFSIRLLQPTYGSFGSYEHKGLPLYLAHRKLLI